jgi:hypothetical protein
VHILGSASAYRWLIYAVAKEKKAKKKKDKKDKKDKKEKKPRNPRASPHRDEKAEPREGRDKGSEDTARQKLVCSECRLCQKLFRARPGNDKDVCRRCATPKAQCIACGVEFATEHKDKEENSKCNECKKR